MRLVEIFDLCEKVSMEDYRSQTSSISKKVMKTILADVTAGKLNPDASDFKQKIKKTFINWLTPVFKKLTTTYPLKYQTSVGDKEIPSSWYFFDMKSAKDVFADWLQYGGRPTDNQEEKTNGFFTGTIQGKKLVVMIEVAIPDVALSPLFWKLAAKDAKEFNNRVIEVARIISSTFVHEATHYHQAYEIGANWYNTLGVNTKGGQLGYKETDDYHYFLDDKEVDAFAAGVAATLISLIEEGRIINASGAKTLLRSRAGIENLRKVSPVIGYYYDAFKYFFFKPHTYKWREETKKGRIAKTLYASFIKKVLFHLDEWEKAQTNPPTQPQSMLRQIANKILSFFKSETSD